ncbi:50S ribosomal protein L13 [Candidatus Woesearchaeota archaeon]|nr:50S ribosomal protein L13 [Candidatus Woesearchaeota archaeon]
MIIIDGTELILGRLASYAAKQLLLGENVHIINCEKVIDTGSKQQILKKYKRRMERGTPRKGPFMHRMPHRIVKRTVRGMLPYKKARGKDAYKRLRCHIGIPEELQDKKTISFKDAHLSKLPNVKYLDLKTISHRIGAKIE